MILNLTPHPIRLFRDGEAEPYEEIPVGGPPVRLATIDLGTQLGYGAPVELVEFGHAHDLPNKMPDTWLIVSLPVALSLTGRDDLLVPYLEVRNDEGTVIGCRMLAQPV